MPYRCRLEGVLIVGIALLLCGGCGGPVEPNLRAADLILVGLESGRLLLVDSKTPAVVGEIGPRAYPVHGSVVGRDGKRLFFSGKYPDNSWKLVAVDLNERQLFWALDQATPQGTIPSYSGVKLIPGSDALAVSSDGVVLYVNPAAQGTTTGIAVLDITTREVRGFWGPILSSGMTTLSGSAAADTLVVIGTRTADDDLIRDSVYVLRTGVSFEVLRVIPPPPGSTQIWSVARASGLSFYAAGNNTIGVYDLASNGYSAVRSRQGFGAAVSSHDGSMVVLPDPGDPPTAPTGLLPVLGAGLQPGRIVDLRSLSTSSVPPATTHVAFSPTATELFVTAGSTHIRQDFNPEPGRLVIVDYLTGAVRGTLNLQDWGHARVFTLP